MHNVTLIMNPFEGFLVGEFFGSSKCLQYMFKIWLANGELVQKDEG